MKKMKRIIVLALMTLSIMAIAMSAAPASAELGISVGSTAYVNITSGTLNIRASASTSATVVASGTKGQPLTILGFTSSGTVVNGSGYWYKVELQKSPYTQGWAHHSYISRINPGTGSGGTPAGSEIGFIQMLDVSGAVVGDHAPNIQVYKDAILSFVRNNGGEYQNFGDIECTQHTTCNSNKNYTLSLAITGGTTKQCISACAVRADTLRFNRKCSNCGDNHQAFDIMFKFDVHSNPNCTRKSGPYGFSWN